MYILLTRISNVTFNPQLVLFIVSPYNDLVRSAFVGSDLVRIGDCLRRVNSTIYKLLFILISFRMI